MDKYLERRRRTQGKPRSGMHWTPDEDKMVIEHSCKDIELAELLDRSEMAIQLRRFRLEQTLKHGTRRAIVCRIGEYASDEIIECNTESLERIVGGKFYMVKICGALFAIINAENKCEPNRTIYDKKGSKMFVATGDFVIVKHRYDTFLSLSDSEVDMLMQIVYKPEKEFGPNMVRTTPELYSKFNRRGADAEEETLTE